LYSGWWYGNVKRRQHLASLDSLAGTPLTDGGDPSSDRPEGDAASARGDGSHPGPPRFLAVDDALEDGLGNDQEDREALAPRNPDPEAEYVWSVVDAPDGSAAVVADDPVVKFDPDVPGEYTLALDAPDGRHRLTVQVFPEEDEDDPRPRVSLDAEVVGDHVILNATATPPPSSDALDPDLDVELYVDDRDRDALLGEDGVVRASRIEDPVRIHAVAAGRRHSVADCVRLVPDGDDVRVEHPYETPEWARDAVFYQIFTRRFPDQDDPTFETIADRVEYLADLGVDAVWMTPFLEANSSFGNPDEMGGPHGYDTTDYFSVDPALGTMAEFEALVDTCHDHGIKVIFDLVINHTSVYHPFYQAASDPGHEDHEVYRDWYRWEDPDDLVPDTYFGWSSIPNLNYGNLAVREYVLDVVEFWAEKIDGFRCDVAWGVQHGFWKEVYDRVREIDPEFLMLDESIPYFAQFSEGEFNIHHDNRLHGAFECIGNGDAPASAVLDAVEHRVTAGSPSYRSFLQYVENHDLDRYLSEHGRAAQKAAGAATFTLPGNPLLYYGQETGLEGHRDAMNWGEFDGDLNQFYRTLVDARHSIPALGYEADIERIPYHSESDAVVAFSRIADDQRVVVILNFAEDPQTVRVGQYVDATDLLTGEDLDPAANDEYGFLEFEVDTVAVLDADRPEPFELPGDANPERPDADADAAIDTDDGMAATTVIGDDETVE
jgi:glycosidase